jgi:hypothetical protein
MNICAYNIQQHSTTFSEDLRFYVVDDEFGEKTISILLDGEESEMVFIDHPHVEMSVSIRSLPASTDSELKRQTPCETRELSLLLAWTCLLPEPYSASFRHYFQTGETQRFGFCESQWAKSRKIKQETCTRSCA